MMKTLVLESFPYGREARKSRWLERQTEFKEKGINIEFAEHKVNGKGEKPNNEMLNWQGAFFAIEGYDFIFLHDGDNNPDYRGEMIRKNRPFVCYSGGSISLDIDRISKLMIDSMPLELFESNVRIFLEKLAADQDLSIETLHTLIGYDPRLEAQLELLHQCLTPEQALACDFPVNLRKDEDGKVTGLEDKFAKFRMKIKGKTNRNTFDSDYISALEDLRKEVLRD